METVVVRVDLHTTLAVAVELAVWELIQLQELMVAPVLQAQSSDLTTSGQAAAVALVIRLLEATAVSEVAVELLSEQLLAVLV
jgi:hypothetical protein